MFKILSILAILIANFFSFKTLANIGPLFAPKSHLTFPIEYSSEGLLENEYYEVISRIIDVYRPEIEDGETVLNIISDWSDETINAYADRLPGLWILNLPGGYARIPGMTKDAYALIVCHELGHHLGGAPRFSKGNSWASSEGQSDYWASSICFPRIFTKDNNKEIIKNIKIDPIVKNACLKRFQNENDFSLCIRQSYAALVLNSVLQIYKAQEDDLPEFQKRDKSIVYKTYLKHPKAQCRVDTSFFAALCNSHRTKENCLRKQDSKESYARPLCWYRPESDLVFNKEELNRDVLTNLPFYAAEGNYKKFEYARRLDDFDINVKVKGEKDSVYMASENGKLEFLKYLYSFNNLNDFHKTDNNNTPVGIATVKGHLEVVRYFVEDLKVDIHEFSYQGSPVLYLSAKYNHKDIFDYLLSLPEININQGNHFDDTALFIAIEEDNYDIIDTLLNREEIDLAHKNRDGDSAYDLAEFYDNNELMEYLLTGLH